MNDLVRLFAVAGGRSWALRHPAITFTKAAVRTCGAHMGELGDRPVATEPTIPDWLVAELPTSGSLWLADKQHAYLTAMREVCFEGLPGHPYRPLADWLMRCIADAEAHHDDEALEWVKAVFRVGIGCLPLRGHADWRVAIIAKHIDLMAVMLARLEREGVTVLGMGKTDAFLVWSATEGPPAGIHSKADPFDLAAALELVGGAHPPRSLSALVAQARRLKVITHA
jgi:hypothetical protein